MCSEKLKVRTALHTTIDACPAGADCFSYIPQEGIFTTPKQILC